MPTFPRPSTRLAAVLLLVLALVGCATPPPADEPADAKHAALTQFIVAYRLADAWPQSAPKIARDSMPRLEAASRDAIAADPLPSRAARDAAQQRLAALLPQGRADLETALRALDADELAAFTAYEIYGKVFTTTEIRAMTDFYASPTGAKLSAEAPAILAESRRGGSVAATDAAVQRRFTPEEFAQITAFWRSPVGLKMNATAERIREDMHAHFVEVSEPALRAVARRLATQAEQP